MPNQISPELLAKALTLKIENAGFLPKSLPALSLGDILRVIVRQNPPDGLGLIAFKGLAVRASLPANVEVGDVLQAQLTQQQDQVVLKILDIDKTAAVAPAPALTQQPITKIVSEVENLLRSLQAPRALNPLQVSEALKDLGAFEQQLQTLLSSVADADDLAEPQAALRQLIASTDGKLAPMFRQAAAVIRAFAEQYAPSPQERALLAVREQLATLLQRSGENNQFAARSLDQLTTLLQHEVQEKKQGGTAEKESTRQVLREIRLAQTAAQHSQTEEVKSHLQAALQQLQFLDGDDAAEPLRLTVRTASEMQQLASRLEQLAGAQETLTRLNPVFQALGEPALVLFPFLFQGLLSHSEVTVESRRVNEKEEGRKKGGGAKSEPFQRVQVSIPLPSLGTIDADIAHRSKEILVRLTTSDPDVGRFLTDQLEHLAASLREQGFERAELVANVGLKPTADWSAQLHAAMSLIA